MSHSVPHRQRNWPWVVAVLGAVVVIIVGASVASSMIGSGDNEQATAPTTPIVASETPTALPSNSTPTPSNSPQPTAIEGDDIDDIEAAIESDNPAGLYDYLADPVHVSFAASDFDADRTPDQAVIDLDYTEGATGWNWDLDEATLAAFRAGRYAAEFPDDAIIGQSAETYVIAFTVEGPDIASIFVSKSAALVTEPPPAVP